MKDVIKWKKQNNIRIQYKYIHISLHQQNSFVMMNTIFTSIVQ